MRTSAAVRILLEASLDYAGLFPPARLSLPAAWREYRRAAASPERWLLRSFVCPAARLGELAELAIAEPAPPLQPGLFSVIGSQPAEPGDWERQAEADADAMGAFYQTMKSFHRTQRSPMFSDDLGDAFNLHLSYETRLPATGVAAAQPGQRMLQLFAERGVPCSSLFMETALGAFEASWGASFVDGLGWKFRTGGLEASAFPTVDQLAEAVVELALLPKPSLSSMDMPPRCWKATAGLHHALPYYDKALGVTMQGFLNVFLAATLTRAMAQASASGSAAAEPGQLKHTLRNLARELLNNSRGASIRWHHDGVQWGDAQASLGEIREARRYGLVSFGSCSFAEPVAELQALQLL